MSQTISVILSQDQNNHPQKRAIVEAIVAGLIGIPGIDTTVVPHLVDVSPHSPTLQSFSHRREDVIVCAWLYPRAIHWLLHQYGIRGQIGKTSIPAFGEEEAGMEPAPEPDAPQVNPCISSPPEIPARTIYCLDLRTRGSALAYIAEIQRIAGSRSIESPEIHAESCWTPKTMEPAQHRWYPVIDYSRCTNCLECINFCLFGVYGLDTTGTILVELPDNCRKGCPACSRICPVSAIMFPQHKMPSIAGGSKVGGPLKIDLSTLFGESAPSQQTKAETRNQALAERDECLHQAGHHPVGSSDRDPKKPIHKTATNATTNAMDRLIDQLDATDL